jgi:hypothetical protein
MFSKLSSFARTGVIALVALGSLPAEAAPFGPVRQPALADSAARPIPVAQGEGRDCGPGYSCGFRGPRAFRRGGWDGRRWDGRRHWRRGDGWNDRRAWRRHHRRHWRRGWDDGAAGFALGFGLGVPLGYYGGYYNEPVYRPRRVYRGGGGAHVEWCYNRYRSYRAWDNSWQPYYGPRRLCFSPYS